MAQLPIATCHACLAFLTARRNDDGIAFGRCHLRKELGEIPQHFQVCSKFAIRPRMEGKVTVPKAKRVMRGRGGSQREGDTVEAFTATRTPTPTLEKPSMGRTEGEIDMDRDGLKQIFRELLEEETMYGYCALGKKWEGGTLVLKPADESLQSKEIPIDGLFHKIVMIRDRLRVLEAKVNANKSLSEIEKVELQQYVSKCYGTLTSFNVLFQEKADHFKSK